MKAKPEDRTDRVPPHDLGAEAAVLGAMLLSADALTVGLGLLSAGDFYKPAHGHVFDAAARLAARGEPVDAVSVATELAGQQLLETIGGRAVLTDLLSDTPSTANVGRYARTVADTKLLRDLIGAGDEIRDLAYDWPDDATETLDAAQSRLFALGAHRRHGAAVPAGAALGEWLVELEALQAGEGPVGQPTGWVDLDTMLLGLHAGQLITVAARPSMGKTAWGLALALEVAKRTGTTAAFVSAEMGLRDLLTRMVANAAQVDSQSLRSGRVGDIDMARVVSTIAASQDLPLYIIDDPAASLGSIRAECRRLVNSAGLGLVVVDYLQLLDGEAGAENRQVEVATLCRGLKRLARELAVPVVCLAQLNRNLEVRANKRPSLADIRESGEVENSSDVVIGLYRDEYYNPESEDRGVLEVIVLKQRNGPVGTVRLAYNERYGSIRNFTRQEAF